MDEWRSVQAADEWVYGIRLSISVVTYEPLLFILLNSYHYLIVAIKKAFGGR